MLKEKGFIAPVEIKAKAPLPAKVPIPVMLLPPIARAPLMVSPDFRTFKLAAPVSAPVKVVADIEPVPVML